MSTKLFGSLGVGDKVGRDAFISELTISHPYNDVAVTNLSVTAMGMNGKWLHPEKLARAMEAALDGDLPVIVKCAHCGQWAARKTACKHCGAPVD